MGVINKEPRNGDRVGLYDWRENEQTVTQDELNSIAL